MNTAQQANMATALMFIIGCMMMFAGFAGTSDAQMIDRNVPQQRQQIDLRSVFIENAYNNDITISFSRNGKEKDYVTYSVKQLSEWTSPVCTAKPTIRISTGTQLVSYGLTQGHVYHFNWNAKANQWELQDKGLKSR